VVRNEIIRALQTNDRAVLKAVVKIYHRQTFDERATLMTQHQNGRGFNAADARPLSNYAQRLLDPEGEVLTLAEIAECRQRIMKYVGQLEEEAAIKMLHKWENNNA
jgi:hypothetical protein